MQIDNLEDIFVGLTKSVGENDSVVSEFDGVDTLEITRSPTSRCEQLHYCKNTLEKVISLLATNRLELRCYPKDE